MNNSFILIWIIIILTKFLINYNYNFNQVLNKNMKQQAKKPFPRIALGIRSTCYSYIDIVTLICKIKYLSKQDRAILINTKIID